MRRFRHRTKYGAIVLALFAFGLGSTSGCTNGDTDDGSDKEVSEAELTVDDSAGVADRPGDDPAPRHAEPTVADVDEREAATAEYLDPDSIDAAMTSQIETVELPVLLPDDQSLLDDGTFFGGEHFYTFTTHVTDEQGEQDHMIVVEGSRMQADLPDAQREYVEEARRDGAYDITRIHKIPTLTFDRFGVSYSVNIECNRPHENVHCTDDDTLTALADSLKRAGGRR